MKSSKSLSALIIALILISCSIFGQTADNKERKLHFFGSLHTGFSNLLAKVQPDLAKPESDEANKLKNGTVKQFEIGLLYNSLGIAFEYNRFKTSANTDYSGYDLNRDGVMENGQLNDDFHLSYTGCVFLYKFYFFKRKLDLTYKYSLGWQKYYLAKQIQLFGAYGGMLAENIEGSKFSQLIGIETNIHFLKYFSFGIEANLIPNKFTKLTINGQEATLSEPEVVSRLNYGIKISIEI